MRVIGFEIEGLKLIEPDVFEDERGYFFELYSQQKLKELGIGDIFVQDNESKSVKGVLRGLHFQKEPYAQAKLVRVVKGKVRDVAVDIRKNSPTYGKYVIVELSEENKKMFFIPEGFAHGFVVLEDDTIFQYKCSNFYNKASEGSILWNDKTLNINWHIDFEPIISEKDQRATTFDQFTR
ncbi:MAG: dTDP-4-dehydrorhamnose 3,5-epimerase [Bacteroidales bacterium]|jgi:dTDP-4-dehydrorhamnose 3,5-epimerase|nr:dTDP-4-dehydrorhamnose 3,5-epimerase [Bacteroidales bacterium]